MLYFIAMHRLVRFLASVAAAGDLAAQPVRADPVDKIVEAQMAEHHVPGVALTIIQDGRRIRTSAYGFANLEWKVRVTPDTVFEIGSITKQFTAACILLLEQEGRLSVDDPVGKYLPDAPSSWSRITLRHLLNHTSGIRSYTGQEGFELARHLTQAQFVQKAGAWPLEFEPGAKYAYCNTGFNLLGYIIENVGGTNYWAFLSSRILVPAGMKDTADRNPKNLIPRRASGYELGGDGRMVNRDSDITDVFSAGAMASTIGDLAVWNGVLDTDKVLSNASKKKMWSPTVLNDGTVHAYSFAWWLDPVEGHQRVGHTGETSGFNASFERFPDDRLCIIVLSNSGESERADTIARAIAPLYFKSRL